MDKKAKLPSFLEEGLRILEEAKNQDIVLRIMGSIAVRLHCPSSMNLIEKLDRPITDIDYVGYEKQSNRLEKFFQEMGYVSRQLSYSFRQMGRMIFLDPDTQNVVDIFLDKLEMCHTVDYRKRLELDYPTVPLAEVLMQKMQIIMLSEKDVKDTIVLLREHGVGDTDEETINIKHIANVLSDDWGFYHTFTTNLGKVKNLVAGFTILSDEDRFIVKERIDQALEMIEDEPKSRGWKMRSKIGTKKKWYRDVFSAPK